MTHHTYGHYWRRRRRRRSTISSSGGGGGRRSSSTPVLTAGSSGTMLLTLLLKSQYLDRDSAAGDRPTTTTTTGRGAGTGSTIDIGSSIGGAHSCSPTMTERRAMSMRRDPSHIPSPRHRTAVFTPPLMIPTAESTWGSIMTPIGMDISRCL